MSLLDQLDTNIRPFAQELFDIARMANVRPRVTSGIRSYATQQQLYKAWLAGHSKYPAAPPGHSAHEYGLAFDMVVDGDVNQSDCGVVWRSWGGIYGGEEDPIHFEHPLFRYLPLRPDPTPAVQQVPVYTPSSTLVRARKLADLIEPYVLQELGYSESIEAIAHAIEIVLGRNDPAALGAIDYGLQHPEEFFGTYWDAMRSVLLSEIL